MASLVSKGNKISDSSTIINLYNKYKGSSYFRTYTYTSTQEFFADIVAYYYMKYILKDSSYNISYPSDIKTTVENYLNNPGV